MGPSFAGQVLASVAGFAALAKIMKTLLFLRVSFFLFFSRAPSKISNAAQLLALVVQLGFGFSFVLAR